MALIWKNRQLLLPNLFIFYIQKLVSWEKHSVQNGESSYELQAIHFQAWCIPHLHCAQKATSTRPAYQVPLAARDCWSGSWVATGMDLKQWCSPFFGQWTIFIKIISDGELCYAETSWTTSPGMHNLFAIAGLITFIFMNYGRQCVQVIFYELRLGIERFAIRDCCWPWCIFESFSGLLSPDSPQRKSR